MDVALQYASDWWWLGRGLAPYLAEAVVPGSFFAWTSADEISAPNLNSLAGLRSGLLSEAVGQAGSRHLPLVEVVSSAMGRGGIWLAVDAMASPGDAFLAADSNYIAAGDAIYRAAIFPDPRRIAGLWRETSSAAGQLGLVGTYPVVSAEEQELRRVVSEASLVVMSAFDGDGVLFFERRLPGDPPSEDLAELLWFGYRGELLVDFISVSELERYVGRKTGDGGQVRMDLTLSVIKFALDSGDARAGAYPDEKAGLREVWNESSDRVIARAKSEWEALGRAPQVGEILWLERAPGSALGRH